MAQYTLGEKEASLLVFQPDSLVSEHLIDMMVAGRVEADLLQIVITDLSTKQQQMVLVAWDKASLGDLTYKLYSALSEDNGDVGVMETFFWLFWQGWAGVLDPNVVADLPNAEEAIIELVRQGHPLRGEQLRRFKATIVWAFANAVGTWGDTDAWKTGDLSPGHLQYRKVMDTYIDQRMTALHGEDYESL
jgi:hypothetical protein